MEVLTREAGEGMDGDVICLAVVSQYYNIKKESAWHFHLQGEKQIEDAIEIRRNSKEKIMGGKAKKIGFFLLIVQ